MYLVSSNLANALAGTTYNKMHLASYLGRYDEFRISNTSKQHLPSYVSK